MAQYRNIGALNGSSAPLVPVNTVKLTQVYQATHDGNQRLPFMNRSFISFSYGSKKDSNGNEVPVNIEDFNLIAYTSGDRMQRDAYASYEDLTSTYDTIPGQFYWGTYFHSNSLSLSLATDGMTQRELDEFKRWFRAGSVRELILAEHPNRAIMARIANPPKLHLLAFEENVDVPFQLGGNVEGEAVTEVLYNTSTTVYRGEIDLEFVMDEPFWYAKQNILGKQNSTQGYYEESWIDANGKVTNIKDSKDALKIVYEDHIPLGSTTKIDVFLGGDIYASVKYELWSQIVQKITQEEYEQALSDPSLTKQNRSAYCNYEGVYYKGAVIAWNDSEDSNEWYGGKIGGAELLGSSAPVEGINLPASETAQLYYAGTAPAPVKLRFTLQPQIIQQDITGQGGAYYIITPQNKHSSGNSYNTITLESSELHEFKFTLPTFWLSYNQVIEIFDNEEIISPGLSWLTVRETIRNTIRHPVVRAWANMLINKYDNEGGTGIITDSIDLPILRGDLERGMQMLITDVNGEPFAASFTFDGKTGLAIGKFTYRNMEGIKINPYKVGENNAELAQQINESAWNYVDITETDEETDETTTTRSRESVKENYTTSQEENVGDMVKSSYLILDERNVLDNYYQVQAWEAAHPDYAYKITHDIANGLQDLHFEFKNMYL